MLMTLMYCSSFICIMHLSKPIHHDWIEFKGSHVLGFTIILLAVILDMLVEDCP